MKHLDNIYIFVKVAEAQNFTKAGTLLGITSSGVSRIITRFESELGVRLFNRSTRAVSLTNDGIGFLARCKEVLSMVADAEESLLQTHGSLKGTVRLTMPMGFGRRVVSCALPVFAASYPDITIEAEFSDRVVDLFYEPVDIAIVRGEVPDSRLIAKKLCTLNFIACASPKYIARFGEPETPEDLVHHHCMAYMGPQMSRYRDWTFARNGRSFNVQVMGKVNTNNAEALLEAAISGLGIVMLSTMYTAEAIRAGKLKMLLTDFIPPGTVVSATYLPNRVMQPRIRTFVDFLSNLVPSPPDWYDLPFDSIPESIRRHC